MSILTKNYEDLKEKNNLNLLTQSNQLSINEQINFTFSDSPSKNSDMRFSVKGKKYNINTLSSTNNKEIYEINDNFSDEEISFDNNKKEKLKNNIINKEEKENLNKKISELEKENLCLKENLLNKENLEKELNNLKLENKSYKEQIDDLNNQVKKLIEIKSNLILENNYEDEEKRNLKKEQNLQIEKNKELKIIKEEKINLIEEKKDNKDNNDNKKSTNDEIEKLNEIILNEREENKKLNEEILKLKNEIKEKKECIESLNKNNEEWEDEYYKGLKNLSKIKTENEEKIENLKKIVLAKYKLIISLTDQIKEYEVKCTDILNGLSEEEKDKQLEILINEVNSKRKKIFDILTFNGLISNFEEFEKVVNQIISQFNNKSSKENVENSLKKLDFLINSYKENDRKNNIEILNKLI